MCEISVNIACFGLAFAVFSELFLIYSLGFEVNILNCHRSDDRSYRVNWVGDFLSKSLEISQVGRAFCSTAMPWSDFGLSEIKILQHLQSTKMLQADSFASSPKSIPSLPHQQNSNQSRSSFIC